MSRPLSLLLVTALAVGLGTSCGSSSTGGNAPPSDDPGDPVAPTARIAFPPAGGEPVLTDASSVVVTGSAFAVVGVAAVHVNGVAATTDDGFQTWRATVALAEGTNTLDVRTEGMDGGVDERAASVEVRRESASLRAPVAVAFDAMRQRLLVVDAVARAVVGVNPASGARSVLSSDARGSGPAFVRPRGLAVDTSRDELYVSDPGLSAILAVDPVTGDRRVLLQTPPLFPAGLAFDRTRDALLVADSGDDSLVVPIVNSELWSIDLGSATLQLVSGQGMGTGPSLIGVTGVDFDPQRAQVAIVAVPSPASVLEVQVATGNRRAVAGAGIGQGIELVRPTDVAFTPDGTHAVIADAGAGRLVRLNLQTLERTVLADGQSPGAELLAPLSVSLDVAGNAFTADAGRDSVMGVDGGSGTVAVVSETAVGTGPRLFTPTGIGRTRLGDLFVADDARLAVLFASPGGARSFVSGGAFGTGESFGQLVDLKVDVPFEPIVDLVYVTDVERRAVFEVLGTGERRVVSGLGVGAGPELEHPLDMAFDVGLVIGPTPTALVADAQASGGAILRMELGDGDRTLVSGQGRGEGPALVFPRAVAFDSLRQRALVVDGTLEALFAVDLSTGDRTEITAPDTSTGLGIVDVAEVVYDRLRDRALVLSTSRAEILAVDLVSGVRSVVTGAEVGRGPALARPSSLALDPSRDVGYVTDAELGAVIAVELASGDRVLVQR